MRLLNLNVLLQITEEFKRLIVTLTMKVASKFFKIVDVRFDFVKIHCPKFQGSILFIKIRFGEQQGYVMSVSKVPLQYIV